MDSFETAQEVPIRRSSIAMIHSFRVEGADFQQNVAQLLPPRLAHVLDRPDRMADIDAQYVQRVPRNHREGAQVEAHPQRRQAILGSRGALDVSCHELLMDIDNPRGNGVGRRGHAAGAAINEIGEDQRVPPGHDGEIPALWPALSGPRTAMLLLHVLFTGK